MRVLVLGATGYVGGRLVPELLEAGLDVRCGVRDPARLSGRPWRAHVEVVRADVDDAESMAAACRDVDVLVFLVHAMAGHGDFATRERDGARIVRDAAAAAGVGRIVYLGGLGREDDRLSDHLRSRQAVGREFAQGPVPVVELRAGVVLGSGSTSFEMLRHLVDVLPVMVAPKWVDTRTQPIAVRDVLRYLVAAVDPDRIPPGVYEVGGADVLTYRELLQRYARIAGLRRRVILPVPVLTPRLSSLWIGLVTPLPTSVARPLVDSLVNEVVVRDDRIRRYVSFEPTGVDEAVRRALQRVRDLQVDSTWASAGAGDPSGPRPEDPDWSGGAMLGDVRRVATTATPERLFATLCAIGGTSGYHSPRLLWSIRGALDELVGGVGLRRGRRHPTELLVGDPVDFWRVEALDPPHLLRLRAEMRVPGQAWLEFHVETDDDGGVHLVQRARFHPRGLWGRVYWYGMSVFHGLVFPTMARRLVRAAEADSGE
ncbi:MAG: SDR family oxidoreductase [Nitriliruptoraceae bacterium]